MKNIENIKKSSLVLFIITGFLHLGSSIFIANEIYLKEMSILNKSMDIPLILTGLIYGFSSARIGLTDPNKEYKKLDISLAIIIILLLLAVILINLFVPDFQQ